MKPEETKITVLDCFVNPIWRRIIGVIGAAIQFGVFALSGLHGSLWYNLAIIGFGILVSFYIREERNKAIDIAVIDARIEARRHVVSQ